MPIEAKTVLDEGIASKVLTAGETTTVSEMAHAKTALAGSSTPATKEKAALGAPKGDLAQRQAQVAEDDDAFQLPEVFVAIQTVAARRAVAGLQQAEPVVVMQRPDCNVGEHGELLDAKHEWFLLLQ